MLKNGFFLLMCDSPGFSNQGPKDYVSLDIRFPYLTLLARTIYGF